MQQERWLDCLRKGFDRLMTSIENGRGEGEEMVQADERQGMW